MSDPRLTLFDGQVAHVSLQGRVDANSFTKGTWRRCGKSTANLTRANGSQDKQLLLGERFLVISQNDHGQSFGQCERDGYVGWVNTNDLDADVPCDLKVVTLGTHCYSEPDIKSAPIEWLPMGAEVVKHSEQPNAAPQFTAISITKNQIGYVPSPHLAALSLTSPDPAIVAQTFLNAPYLWAGDSYHGIDCSGLIQRALLSCGIACPRDSDQQEATLGRVLGEHEPPNRGDIVFWKGHVGMITDENQIIHANAFHMAVAQEPFTQACSRIGQKEFGEITSIQRLSA
jgi:hypothetical protein